MSGKDLLITMCCRGCLLSRLGVMFWCRAEVRVVLCSGVNVKMRGGCLKRAQKGVLQVEGRTGDSLQLLSERKSR